MKKRKTPIIILCSIFMMIIVGITMFVYVNYVQHSLWNQAVNDIMSSTKQEQKAFQLYIDKDIESLSSILKGVSLENENVRETVMHHSEQEGINYVYINLKNKTFVNNQGEEKLLDEELTKIKALSNQGITKPYFNRINGIKMVATYIKSNDEMLIKETRVDYIAEHFSLSFYNDLGFSYIIDHTGNVLIRADHKNANRTMQNLFDIIDLEGNDHQTVSSFEDALLKNEKGYAVFNYHKDQNVFCYVPITTTNGWYIVSVIPNDAIMAQANHIIMYTIILSLIIIGAIACVLLLFRKTDRKQQNQIMHLAYYDDLTNLYNYQKFKEEGNKRLKDEQTSWAVIYCDIDGFKVINDVHGYEFGDTILIELAKILEKYKTPNGLTCHMTADKYLIMCDYQDKSELIELCANIVQEFIDVLKGKGLDKETVMIFGICCLEDDVEINNIEGMVDRSHMALKEVNDNHQVYYRFYDHSMREQLMKEAEIESKMEKALENNEFVFYLQPKYNTEGTKVLGAEALVRWIDHDGHMNMPGDFIPIFEKDGFILKLDEFIYESVCKYLAYCIQNDKPTVCISVNISRLHLFQKDFVKRYVDIKKKYHIPDQLLELEITENVLLEDMNNIKVILNQLKNYGFSYSIDDFGSGYSSLNILKDLPFDVIKLDKVFLDPSENVKRSEEIIESIIKMAKHLGMKTVAEGVETEEQLSFLRNHGCDMIQGYIFSKPVPVDEFEKNWYKILNKND